MILWSLAAAVLALSLGATLEALRSRRQVGRLDRQEPGENGTLPRVSVIAAAHDEESALEAAARSLMNQDYPDLEIVLVDDRSRDHTGEIMDGLAREDPRIRVLHIEELPPGWMGKNHALWRGWQAATGDWLLFTDADVHMDPSTVRRAMSYARRQDLDHLTVAPLLDARGLLLSAWVGLFTFLFIAFQRPQRAQDPRSGDGIGVGAFNLIRRDVYEDIGTHRAIALRPDDDLQLGKQVKRHGYRQGLLVAGDLVRVAWYRTVGEAVRGLEKNTLAAVDYRWGKAIAGVTIVALWTLFPWAGLFVADAWVRGLSASAILVQVVGYLLSNPPSLWRGAVVYPVAAALLVYSLARAVVLTAARRGIWWGDRFFSLAELRRGAAPAEVAKPGGKA